MTRHAKMTVIPKTEEVVDLVEFRRLKELVKKQSAALIADKLTEIKKNLKELHGLVEISGIAITIYDHIGDEMNAIGELQQDWQSSSYNC